MAESIWTEPALSDVDSIADYIALDKPDAARQLVQRIFEHVEQLIDQPESGSKPKELRSSRCRQIIETPSAFSTDTTGNEYSFFMSCAVRCDCGRQSSLRATSRGTRRSNCDERGSAKSMHVDNSIWIDPVRTVHGLALPLPRTDPGTSAAALRIMLFTVSARRCSNASNFGPHGAGGW